MSKMEKRVLGRGISALIPEKEIKEAKESIIYLSIDQIKPNPYQPRENFGQEELEDLIASIKEKGIIQPVLVRSSPSGYELIAGERRLRAAKSLHIKEIPAIIKEVKDEESLEIALIENIQRQNLNPIEEAQAYNHLVERFGFTQEKIAQTIGKARVSVTNTLRLLKLPAEVRELLRKNQLTFAHGKVLLELQEPAKQIDLAKQAASGRLSVKELEGLILPHPKARKPSKEKASGGQHQHIQDELQQILGTKVKIVSGHKRGVMHIEFYSPDDLDRIYQVIKR